MKRLLVTLSLVTAGMTAGTGAASAETLVGVYPDRPTCAAVGHIGFTNGLWLSNWRCAAEGTGQAWGLCVVYTFRPDENDLWCRDY